MANFFALFTFKYLIWGDLPGDPVVKTLPSSAGSSGSTPGEGTNLVVQSVKNPPAMWEPWIGSLAWEDPLEKGKATSIVAWRIPWTV